MNEIVNCYTLVKTHKIDNWEELLITRYVALFDKYDYIIGDLSANMLRITGFYSKDFEKKSKYHIRKRCAFDAPYFIIKKKTQEGS